METELGNLLSANGSSVQLSDKSGQVAAPLLSGGVQNAEAAPQRQRESEHLARSMYADIEKQVQNLQEFGRQQGWTVNFSVEKELDQVVIKVMDTETQSMIRQIPSEELIAINKRIQALRQGEAGANPRRGLLLDSEI